MMNTMSGQARAKKLIQQLTDLGITNQEVLRVIAETPRHVFMPESLAHKAYENTALPIGNGQTISQPLMVATMTQLLMQHNCHNVLEIGTGSGYQTAILAQLVDKVFSVERIAQLQYQAKRRLRQLDLHNVSMRHGDGWKGWSSKAPFDGIIVTAAASEVPSDLVAQLADGGVMIIPVGDKDEAQSLTVIRRFGDSVEQQQIGDVRFVPLVKGELS
ncbi:MULTISPECIES: protein-L-isoaspartate(D-aspartate) O-methyltransferase [Idiomarina]|jgi:protein-L-isoaspartate(D-aspartate) O-methyltransferase|uniref:Protein-L-isoaspartate O-methyltransferase n=2 Tax=Idiomarina zobellii TaxID=86103 RepID=A0A837NCZ3_9GAMM|nr:MULTISPECIES: protein-L-isoaspartate(D-aspartate) O-methyltransferase [Idiomarina]KPD23803.1 protein-L-isoaspartate O-methyltransferase [Idiomarina zobellii]MCH2454565.1 protein-L-isoaspartate(D-aspartate) O-methyltransferase [Idiomarina sp.]MCJ8315538.1 protein-L-isoaspartate(D-aspartate) O-methyltransferase [Idiomarina sp.]NQZ15453.1 protein-L-isoaspartate(D-aspartate) O-methyltransferase [Idiomarina sp.]SDF73578.1 protein-L-isoaspartate(D-aspartate) O-methyltransferase [Idiomarina zobell|tara:strand:+ start:2081 stop:2728 length:648 start_codon:yes stop_codon:yes gene_type:complete